eukprot:2011763-Amphidinium_carterae.2
MLSANRWIIRAIALDAHQELYTNANRSNGMEATIVLGNCHLALATATLRCCLAGFRITSIVSRCSRLL